MGVARRGSWSRLSLLSLLAQLAGGVWAPSLGLTELARLAELLAEGVCGEVGMAREDERAERRTEREKKQPAGSKQKKKPREAKEQWSGERRHT